MIYLEALTVNVGVGAQAQTILNRQTITLPSDRSLAILAHRADHLAAILKVITGTLLPLSGRVVRTAKVSFPIGSGAVFRPNLTCRQNIKYICDLYGVVSAPVVNFVQTTGGLGDGIDLPFVALPAPWRPRFMYALGYGMPFECYLFQEHIGTGDPQFRDICRELYDERLRTAGSIVATRNPKTALRLTASGGILYGGRLHLYDDVRDAARDFASLATPGGEDGDPADGASPEGDS
jgi:capsular polysaccharide transport system ATP-binding protein